MSCSVCHTTEASSLLILTPCEHILCKECHQSPLVLLSCFGCPCCGSFPDGARAVQNDEEDSQQQNGNNCCSTNLIGADEAGEQTTSTSSSSSSNSNGLSSCPSISSTQDLAPVMSARRRRFLNKKAAKQLTSSTTVVLSSSDSDMYLHVHGQVEYFEEGRSSGEEEDVAIVEDDESDDDEDEEWPSPFGVQALGGPKMQGGRRRKSHMLKKMSQARDQRKAEVKALCSKACNRRARWNPIPSNFPPQNYLDGR